MSRYIPKTDRRRGLIMRLARTYAKLWRTIQVDNLKPALTRSQADRAIAYLYEHGELVKVKPGIPGRKQAVFKATDKLRPVHLTNRWGKYL